MNVGNTLQAVNSELIVREPKTAAGRRRIPLTGETVDALKERSAAQADYIETHDDYSTEGLVVCREDGSPWHPSTFSAAWIRAREAAGVTVRFHELRHTHASLLVRSGAHPKTLQERLGHSSAAFTMSVYAHLLPGVQEQAVADLEAMLKRVESESEKKAGQQDGHQAGTSSGKYVSRGEESLLRRRAQKPCKTQWRSDMGVEPTQDRITAPQTVLKTAPVTGLGAAPRRRYLLTAGERGHPPLPALVGQTAGRPSQGGRPSSEPIRRRATRKGRRA